jgi:hypothetical protein
VDLLSATRSEKICYNLKKKDKAMQTITIKLEDSISDKVLWLLKHFDKSEVEILDSSFYESDDEYLKSIKGMKESIIEAANEPIENYVTRDELEW